MLKGASVSFFVLIFVERNLIMKNADKPAYPITEDAKNRIYSGETFNGLTKREHFALELSKATIIGLNSACVDGSYHGWSNEDIVNEGIYLADELLKQLEK